MYAQSETDTLDVVPGLRAGDYPVENVPVTLLSGAGVIDDFTVVGMVTASGKYVPCDLGASDGSEVPTGILVYGGDATSADVNVQMYVSGVFNTEALIWDASFTTDAQKLAAFPNPPLMCKKVAPAI